MLLGPDLVNPRPSEEEIVAGWDRKYFQGYGHASWSYIHIQSNNTSRLVLS